MPGSRNSLSSTDSAPKARSEFSLPGMPRCSIIIPTYNNRHVLPLTLAALWQQAVPAGGEIEVIISDDGSTDGTQAFLQSLVVPPAWQVRIISGEHTGVSGARNRGVADATGAVVLLLGADIIVRPGALAAHLNFHHQHPDEHAAALGTVTWDPRINPSRLMVWMIHGGHHNNYDALLGIIRADPTHFLYGAFVSLKRSLLLKEPFSPAFHGYGWEDLELGRRLAARGVALHILPTQALHHHYYRVSDVCARQYAAGKNLHTYHDLHPADGLSPRQSWQQIARHRLAGWLRFPQILCWMVTYIEKYWTTPRLFRLVTAVYFWQGWLRGPAPHSKKG